MENEKIFINVEEARKILGIGRNLMLDLVKIDGFPCIRLRRKIIIDKRHLLEWVEQNYGQYTY